MSWLDDAEQQRQNLENKNEELRRQISNGFIAEKQELRNMLNDIGAKTGWSLLKEKREEDISLYEWTYSCSQTEQASGFSIPKRILRVTVGIEFSGEFVSQYYFSYLFDSDEVGKSQSSKIVATTIANLKIEISDRWLRLRKDFDVVRLMRRS